MIAGTFTDTWEWTLRSPSGRYENEIMLHAGTPSNSLMEMVSAFRQFIGNNADDGLPRDDDAPSWWSCANGSLKRQRLHAYLPNCDPDGEPCTFTKLRSRLLGHVRADQTFGAR